MLVTLYEYWPSDVVAGLTALCLEQLATPALVTYAKL